MKEGTKVRFTSNQLGLMTNVMNHYFEPEVANKGDEGTYLRPHPTIPDWHVIQVKVDGRSEDFFAPVHESMFEEVS